MISHKTTPYNGTVFSLMRIQNIFISKTFWYYNNVYQPQYNNHLAETLSSHILHTEYTIKTASTYWVMDFQLWQGMEPPFASVPLEMDTLGSTRTSCNSATHDRPLISLERIECISPTVGITNRFPNGTASTIDFWEVNETLDQVIIHPTSMRST